MTHLHRFLLLVCAILALAACSDPSPPSSEATLYLDGEVAWNWKTDGESQVRRYLSAFDATWGGVYRPMPEGEYLDSPPGAWLRVEVENSQRVDTATETHKALMFAKLARVCALNLAEPSTYDSLQITYNEGEWTHRYAVSSFSPPAYWETESREANQNPEGE